MDKVEAVNAFAVMAKMQDDMNSKVNPSWRHSQYPWYRALWTELGEASDYIQWAWWKNVGPKNFTSKSNELQCYMELADALHFGISMYLMDLADNNGSPESYIADHTHAAVLLYENLSHAMERVVQREDSLMELIETVSRDALSDHQFNAAHLFAAAYRAGMGPYGLIAYYHGKNILNVFRQDHGYKQGLYRKNWGTEKNPQEDNVELAEIIEGYRSVWGDENLLKQINSGDYGRHIKLHLTQAYQSLE